MSMEADRVYSRLVETFLLSACMLLAMLTAASCKDFSPSLEIDSSIRNDRNIKLLSFTFVIDSQLGASKGPLISCSMRLSSTSPIAFSAFFFLSFPSKCATLLTTFDKQSLNMLEFPVLQASCMLLSCFDTSIKMLGISITSRGFATSSEFALEKCSVSSSTSVLSDPLTEGTEVEAAEWFELEAASTTGASTEEVEEPDGSL
mmetsp:Transcript_36323/g.81851  ORF Transcript_36323/g.81851 Transcript_36323/m.81851 type:complete len:203 (+) Transcript_36323:1102-1710(+)